MFGWTAAAHTAAPFSLIIHNPRTNKETNKMIETLSLSKYNILSRLADSPDFFILNLLSGNADILSPKEASRLRNMEQPVEPEFVEKGYITNPKEEEKRYRSKYLEFLDQREQDEVQVFFVPRYACNFKCSYCYQTAYDAPANPLTREVVDAFYRYMDSELANRRTYVTVFGGEPLMPGTRSKEELAWLLDGAVQRGLEVAIVTNGYWLSEYIDLLKKSAIREIQVTLDGTREIHDKRRFLHDGGATFDKIAGGIDAALQNRLPVNLRVVVDKENISGLKDLASFSRQMGWTGNPLFKTQLGRNYELHTCQLDSSRLFSRANLYREVYKLVKEYPEFLEFHRPAFSVSRFLFENGNLPDPLFDSCPGTKTEWAFDYTGRIYACTATVGKEGEALGTFYPEIRLDEDAVEQWEDRDVTAIQTCKACELQLACGGGCASVAKNKTGDMNTPDCRPVKELLEMGLTLYFESHYNRKENEK